ncbi:MAG: CPBP family glutamic-type intramembrane protease [Defluviitaleaceae bacterium]|nr:CPBP family glutamic-type intramembrane protease [Defluviitaleaceae bacterium]
MESIYEMTPQRYGRKDGIIALLVWLCYVILISAYAAITSRLSMPWYIFVIVVIIFMSLLVVGVFIVVKIRKQRIVSIGFRKENLGKAIGFGLLISLIPIIFLAILPGIINGFNNVDALGLVVALITTFFFAAHEDVIFVGFIQTRLYGLFQTQVVAIGVGAILFALMHVPPWVINGRLDFGQPLTVVAAFLAWVILHIVFVSVFKKYFSIVPVLILHTIWNYSMNFAQLEGIIDFSIIAIIIAALVACFLYWQSHKRNNNLD